MSKMYYPNKELFKDSVIPDMETYYELVKKFDNDYEGTWAEYAREKLDWFKDFDTTLDSSEAPFYKWFTGGKINVAYNCIDRHLKDKKNKAAIIWEAW